METLKIIQIKNIRKQSSKILNSKIITCKNFNQGQRVLNLIYIIHTIDYECNSYITGRLVIRVITL